MTDGVAWLFCPADRPERYAKAAAQADVVILDLEDGVAPADRPRARDALCGEPLDPERTVVRINPHGTQDQAEDLVALASTRYTRVMLAKTESAEQVAEMAPRQIVALCETPRGVANAVGIADCPSVAAVMWGAEDLVAAMGGRSSRWADGRYRDVARHARSAVLIASGAARKPAIDSVFLTINDLDALAEEAADAVQVGFAAKACIHPRQVPVIRNAFTPTPDELDWANGVLAAAAHEPGVFQLDGVMVDEPVLRQARAIAIRATR